MLFLLNNPLVYTFRKAVYNQVYIVVSIVTKIVEPGVSFYRWFQCFGNSLVSVVIVDAEALRYIPQVPTDYEH